MPWLDRLIGLLILGFGLAVAVTARSIPGLPGQAFGPDVFPTLVGAGLALCGLFLVLRRPPPGDQVAENGAPPARPRWSALAWLLLGMIALILWLDEIGFVLLVSVYLVGFLLLLGVRTVTATLTGIALTLVVHQVFVRFLLVPLPVGLLGSFTG